MSPAVTPPRLCARPFPGGVSRCARSRLQSARSCARVPLRPCVLCGLRRAPAPFARGSPHAPLRGTPPHAPRRGQGALRGRGVPRMPPVEDRKRFEGGGPLRGACGVSPQPHSFPVSLLISRLHIIGVRTVVRLLFRWDSSVGARVSLYGCNTSLCRRQTATVARGHAANYSQRPTRGCPPHAPVEGR